MLEQGYVERQLKPIHWCISDRTALAEAELEYQEASTSSIFVNLAAVSGVPESWGEAGPWNLMIWTTTPWTLPANVAVAVHPDLEYARNPLHRSRVRQGNPHDRRGRAGIPR